jgi:hypothetical protein
MDFLSPFDLFTNCSTDKKLLTFLEGKHLNIPVNKITQAELMKQRNNLIRFINRTVKHVIDEMEFPATPVKEKKTSPAKLPLTKADVKSNIDDKLQMVKDEKQEKHRMNIGEENDEDAAGDDKVKSITKKVGTISLKDPTKINRKLKRQIELITCDILMKRVPEITSQGCFIKIDDQEDRVEYALLDDDDRAFLNKKVRSHGTFGRILPPTEEELEEEYLAILQDEIDEEKQLVTEKKTGFGKFSRQTDQELEDENNSSLQVFEMDK